MNEKKFYTGIINKNGQVPGRTFCWPLPVETFSFFKSDARGWHHSIPYTRVLESIKRDNEELIEIILDADKNIQRS